jgi:hypothetical protein
LAKCANIQRRPFSTLLIIVISESEQAYRNCAYTHMVSQKPEHGIINQRPGCLHFNIPEGVAHKAHHDPKINKEPLVLLGLDVPGQHEGITPVIPAELQPFYIVVKIEIVKGQIFFKLIFVDFIIRTRF